MVSESGIQPDTWEIGNHQGYGLVQWTPPTALQNWCSSNGYSYSSLEGQCAYIEYQMTHGLQFYPSKTSSMTAAQYIVSRDSAYTLGLVFLANFERPANPYQYDRGNQAQYWYDYFSQHAPVSQEPSSPSGDTIQQNGTFTVTYSLGMNVRNSPSTNGQIVSSLSNGQVFNYDQKVKSSGYLWVSHIDTNGQRIYVAIESLDGSSRFGTDSNGFSFTSGSTTTPSVTAGATFKQHGSFTITYANGVNIRTQPSTNAPIHASYSNGQSFNYDEKIAQDGYLWASYVSYSGQRVYVAIKSLTDSTTFGVDSNNFSFPSSTVPTIPVSPSKPSQSPSGTFKQSGSFVTGRTLNIRNSPSTSGVIAAQYNAGQSIYYDQKVESDGYLWISYLSYSGTRRYVAIKSLSTEETFGSDSNNFSFTGSTSLPVSPSTPSQGSQSKAQQIISIARQQLGKPYQYGAAGPNSFDCSGLVQYVFAQVGISMPRVTTQQETVGYAVSLNNLQPGDLLFWGNRGNSYHVAIYTGNGYMLYSPEPGQNVKEIQMKYWMPSFARRVI